MDDVGTASAAAAGSPLPNGFSQPIGSAEADQPADGTAVELKAALTRAIESEEANITLGSVTQRHSERHNGGKKK